MFALLHIPNDGPIKPTKVDRASTADLLARRRRLLLTGPYFAASQDMKAAIRSRALETHAVEAELVRRGELARADALFQGDPVVVPRDEWYARRKGQGLG
jgi:hypothetical protein